MISLRTYHSFRLPWINNLFHFLIRVSFKRMIFRKTLVDNLCLSSVLMMNHHFKVVYFVIRTLEFEMIALLQYLLNDPGNNTIIHIFIIAVIWCHILHTLYVLINNDHFQFRVFLFITLGWKQWISIHIHGLTLEQTP